MDKKRVCLNTLLIVITILVIVSLNLILNSVYPNVIKYSFFGLDTSIVLVLLLGPSVVLYLNLNSYLLATKSKKIK